MDLSCPHCGSQAVAIVTIQVDGEAGEDRGPSRGLQTTVELHVPGRPPW